MGVKRATVWTLEDGRSRRDRFEISSRSRRDRFEISSRSLRDRFEIAERSRRDQSPSTEMVWSYSTVGMTHEMNLRKRKRYCSTRTSRPELVISETSLCMTEACLHGWMDAWSPAPWLVCGCASSV